jgi:hypothetical protein
VRTLKRNPTRLPLPLPTSTALLVLVFVRLFFASCANTAVRGVCMCCVSDAISAGIARHCAWSVWYLGFVVFGVSILPVIILLCMLNDSAVRGVCVYSCMLFKLVSLSCAVHGVGTTHSTRSNSVCYVYIVKVLITKKRPELLRNRVLLTAQALKSTRNQKKGKRGSVASNVEKLAKPITRTTRACICMCA